MPAGKKEKEHQQTTKGMSMKTPATEENLFPYTDREALVSLSSGNRSHIGKGTLSEKDGVIKINFVLRVEIRSRPKSDLEGNEKAELTLDHESYISNFSEQFTSVFVVKATEQELRLRSKEARISIFITSQHTSIGFKTIESMLSHLN